MSDKEKCLENFLEKGLELPSTNTVFCVVEGDIHVINDCSEEHLKTLYSNKDVLEICGVGRRLTYAEVLEMEEYLAKKWATGGKNDE